MYLQSGAARHSQGFVNKNWAVGSYSSGPPARGTPQILVDKTSPMTGRLKVYVIYDNFH